MPVNTDRGLSSEKPRRRTRVQITAWEQLCWQASTLEEQPSTPKLQQSDKIRHMVMGGDALLDAAIYFFSLWLCFFLSKPSALPRQGDDLRALGNEILQVRQDSQASGGCSKQRSSDTFLEQKLEKAI